jgi:RNA polymerase sigma-70 factor, ECF subfamily
VVTGDDGFAELVDLARRGDGEAIAALYRRHHLRLLRVLRSEVGDAAEDVASQTWLEVIGALQRFEGDERGFQSLLYTIARRRVADHRRSLRRRPSIPKAPAEMHDMPDVGTPLEGATIDGLAGDDAARRVSEILAPDAAEIVLLRVVAGLTVEQVARVVGKSPGAVRVQQHRALRKLADALGERSPDGGL